MHLWGSNDAILIWYKILRYVFFFEIVINPGTLSDVLQACTVRFGSVNQNFHLTEVFGMYSTILVIALVREKFVDSENIYSVHTNCL